MTYRNLVNLFINNIDIYCVELNQLKNTDNTNDLLTSTEIEIYRKIVLYIYTEFQTFIETLNLKVLNLAKFRFDKQKVINKQLAYMLFRFQNKENTRIGHTIEDYIVDIVDKHKKTLAKTSNFKIETIKQLFSPFGMEGIIIGVFQINLETGYDPNKGFSDFHELRNLCAHCNTDAIRKKQLIPKSDLITNIQILKDMFVDISNIILNTLKTR